MWNILFNIKFLLCNDKKKHRFSSTLNFLHFVQFFNVIDLPPPDFNEESFYILVLEATKCNFDGAIDKLFIYNIDIHNGNKINNLVF